MSFHGKLYLPLLFALFALFGLGGCHSALFSDSPKECIRPATVRITAVLEEAGRSSGLRAETPGAVTDGEQDNFEPEKVAALKLEKQVEHLLLQVYRKGAPDDEAPVASIFYYRVGKVITVAPGSLQGATEVKPFGEGSSVPDAEASPSEITFDLELEPGTYEFYLLVNDQNIVNILDKKPGTAAVPQSKADLKAYKLEIPAYNGQQYPLLYAGPDTQDFRQPMLGQEVITVPSGNYPASHPYVIKNPVIKLERIFAKAEFYLTTTTDDTANKWTNSALEYATKSSDQGRFLSLTDTKTGRVPVARFFPYEGEFTATGELLSATVGTMDKHITCTVLYDDVSNYQNGSRNGIPKIAKLWQTLPKNNAGAERICYILPMKIAGATEADMPYFSFKINFTGTPGGEVTKYKVPLYTIVDNQKLFEIRRNTIYRIYATLNGDQLIVNGNYVVDPWINRDVDSPW